MNKNLSFMIIISLCLMISIPTFAVNSNANIKDIIRNESIEKYDEKDSVFNLISNASNEVKQDLEEKEIKNIKDLDSSRLFKVYKLIDNIDLYNSYTDGNFSTLISNDFEWELPVYNNQNEIVSTLCVKKGPYLDDLKSKGKTFKAETEDMIKKEEGKFLITRIGNYIPLDGAEILSNPDNIETLLNSNNIEHPSMIKNVLCPYWTYIIYIKDQGKEYGIPYNIRQDLLGLKNGQLYEMKDIIENIKLMYNTNSEYPLGGFGSSNGTGNTAKMVNINTLPIIVLTVILAALSLVFVFNSKRRCKKSCV